MKSEHVQFIGSIPEKYDRHLGPLFFESYGRDLARRVSAPSGGAILEIACGTGISTEHLRDAIPDEIEILATDLNEPMLDYARSMRGELPNVRFERADALDLAFDDKTFDAVACQFGLMFMPDKLAAFRECLRVLRPGGLLAFNVWDSLERNPVALVAHETISTYFDDDPPTFLPVPFGWYDIDVINSMLIEAGFTNLTVDVVSSVAERPSARDVAMGLVEGNPTVNDVRARASAPLEVIIEAVTSALAAAFGNTPLRTPLQAIVFTARRPDS